MSRRSAERGLSRRSLLAASPWLLSGCGYLLYPERNGRTGGRIDTVVLVVDLLWLLPGLVPGIVCLAVDFTTGCVYAPVGSGRTASAGAGDGVEARVEVDRRLRAAGSVAGRRLRLAWGPGSRRPEDLAGGRLVFADGRGREASAPLDALGLLG